MTDTFQLPISTVGKESEAFKRNGGKFNPDGGLHFFGVQALYPISIALSTINSRD
jgi:hypothetical protein